MKHLSQKKNRFNIDPKPTQSCQDVQDSARPASINVIALSNQTLNSILQTFNALKRDIANIKTSSQRAINSSKHKKVVTTKSVRSGPRPVGLIHAFEGDYTSRKASDAVSKKYKKPASVQRGS